MRGQDTEQAPGRRRAAAGGPEPLRQVSADIVTVPNLLSAGRLVGVPVFLWAIVTGHDVLAVCILVLSGLSDYLDGKIARAWGLESRLGQWLDPIADRLYIVTTVVALAWRDIIPWWMVGVLLVRDVIMVVLVAYATRRRIDDIGVHLIGKAATLNLLYAFPMLLLADISDAAAAWALPIGWAFAWWGMGMYWVAAAIYLLQVRQRLHQPKVDPS